MPPKLSSDSLATIAGGSAGLLLIYQVDWSAISRGEKGAVAMLFTGVFLAILGYVANKQQA